VGDQYGFRFCASSPDQVINDDQVNLVVIATRHDSHAPLAQRALDAGRHVFVEKPLALNDEELDQVLVAASHSSGKLIVGFNRRFSPLTVSAREFFRSSHCPLSINYRINAGRIPRSHWVHNPREGGGRIIGEVCHFIDLIHFLTDSLTTRVYAESTSSASQEIINEDSVFISLRLQNGSNASIAYLAEGDPGMPKERIEIMGGGKSFVIDDFQLSSAYEGGREHKTKLRERDKGQKGQIKALCDIVMKGKNAPTALEDLAATTRATFRIMDSLRTCQPFEV
jgi:polar amino acid transport system substrate-binding protein